MSFSQILPNKFKYKIFLCALCFNFLLKFAKVVEMSIKTQLNKWA